MMEAECQSQLLDSILARCQLNVVPISIEVYKGMHENEGTSTNVATLSSAKNTLHEQQKRMTAKEAKYSSP